MAERALVSTPKTFDDLVAGVRAVLITGQAHVDRAYLDTYWNTGRLIDAHILLFKERAGYGEHVIPRLARTLGVGDRLLYRCLRFAREYPILSGRTELGWTHYRVLLDVADKAERRALEVQAQKGRWKADELERRVRALNSAGNVTPATDAPVPSPAVVRKPLVPKRGTPGVHRVATVDGRTVVDLGFACYFDLDEEQARGAAEGALVRLDGAGRIASAEGATKADLFNYRVEIIRVVDGDTLWVRIYVRPRQWVKQKLRLRGLDCPEMATPEGKVAKRFAEGLFAKATAVTINTTKPDKYDRYLADVFLTTEAGEVYLNNALLDNGQAVRKDAWEFGDWEPELVG